MAYLDIGCFGANVKIPGARLKASSPCKRLRMGVPGQIVTGPKFLARAFQFYHLKDGKLLMKGFE